MGAGEMGNDGIGGMAMNLNLNLNPQILTVLLDMCVEAVVIFGAHPDSGQFQVLSTLCS